MLLSWIRTCESYKESKKTCESFTALTVVITEKFMGKEESGGQESMNSHQKDSLLHFIHRFTPSFGKNLPGKSCLVGALS